MREFMRNQSVGVPRGLYYWKYGPLWISFLKNLGYNVIISPKTTVKIVERGSTAAQSELCIPMKIFFGHILKLSEIEPKLDYIFIPRYVSTNKEQYFCPKFMILPESCQYGLEMNNIEPLVLEMNRKKRDLKEDLEMFARNYGFSADEVKKSWKNAEQYFNSYTDQLRSDQNNLDIISFLENWSNIDEKRDDVISKSEELISQKKKKPKILLLGHPYNIYEEFINRSLLKKLNQMNCEILTIERMQQEIFAEPVYINGEYIQYWQNEDEILKTARFFFNNPKMIKGIIFLISFACGPDSLIQEIVMRETAERKIPYLALILDEHSGESGLITRIEAFIEMVKRE